MRYAAVALVLVAATMPAAENRVYRTADEDGSPVFSDRGRGEVLAPVRINTYRADAPPGPALADTSVGDMEARPEPYDTVAVVSPGPGDTIRANGGEVLVEVHVRPALRPGHRPLLLLDGAAAGGNCVDPSAGGARGGLPPRMKEPARGGPAPRTREPARGGLPPRMKEPARGGSRRKDQSPLIACTLSGVHRGPHTLRIELVDGGDAVVGGTAATTFHVQRVALRR